MANNVMIQPRDISPYASAIIDTLVGKADAKKLYIIANKQRLQPDVQNGHANTAIEQMNIET